MTDLLIQLPDDPSRDDVHCGACPHLDLINVRCRLRFGSTRGLRPPACVEAEAKAARCVEIDPADAADRLPPAIANAPIEYRLRVAESSNAELRKMLHAVDKQRDAADAKVRDRAANERLDAAVRAVLAEWDVHTIDPLPEWHGLPAVQYEMLHAIERTLREEAGR